MVVVGLPLSLDGTRGPAAQAAALEIAELTEVLPVPVETYDERLTTITADRSLSQLLKKDWPKTLEELEELRQGSGRA